MADNNIPKDEQIQRLIVELGKKLASVKNVVAVGINVDLRDGININYNSASDPEFKSKYMDYQEEGL